LSHLDPRTNQCELEVQKIIHLQNITNQLPFAFIDANKVLYHIYSLQMFRRKLISQHNKLSPMSLEHTRSLVDQWVPKIKKHQKWKINDSKKDLVEDINIHEETLDMTNNTITEEGEIAKDSNEISINYVMTGKWWNQTNIVIVYNVALDIISENKNPEPKSVEECRHRKDWL